MDPLTLSINLRGVERSLVLWTILDRTNELGVVVYVVITVITKLVCRYVNGLVDATNKITFFCRRCDSS
jgi:hypothetical protein